MRIVLTKDPLAPRAALCRKGFVIPIVANVVAPQAFERLYTAAPQWMHGASYGVGGGRSATQATPPGAKSTPARVVSSVATGPKKTPDDVSYSSPS